MTSKIEKHLSPVSRKKKRESLFELEKKESRKLKNIQKLTEQAKQSPPYHQSKESQSNTSRENVSTFT